MAAPGWDSPPAGWRRAQRLFAPARRGYDADSRDERNRSLRLGYTRRLRAHSRKGPFAGDLRLNGGTSSAHAMRKHLLLPHEPRGIEWNWPRISRDLQVPILPHLLDERRRNP